MADRTSPNPTELVASIGSTDMRSLEAETEADLPADWGAGALRDSRALSSTPAPKMRAKMRVIGLVSLGGAKSRLRELSMATRQTLAPEAFTHSCMATSSPWGVERSMPKPPSDHGYVEPDTSKPNIPTPF